MLLPALQKFYNALKHLEQFSLDNSFFDNIGSIDVFLSEFRSVTLVLQTSLGGNTHPVYQKNLHQYLIKDVKVAEWLNEERVSVVHKHPFTLKKVVRIIIYSWGNAFEFKRFEQTLEDDRPIGDYKQMIRNTFMSIAAPEINFSAQFLFVDGEDKTEINIFDLIEPGVTSMWMFLHEKEIDYWKTVSRDYMNDSDFEAHKRGTIRKRKNSAIIQYAIIGVLYLGLAYFSFNAPNLWEKLTKPETEKELRDEMRTNEEELQNTISLESLQDGKDTIPGNNDTTMYHTSGRK